MPPSAALRASNIVWSSQTLERWIDDPNALVPVRRCHLQWLATMDLPSPHEARDLAGLDLDVQTLLEFADRLHLAVRVQQSLRRKWCSSHVASLGGALVGQAAADKRPILLKDSPPDFIKPPPAKLSARGILEQVHLWCGVVLCIPLVLLDRSVDATNAYIANDSVKHVAVDYEYERYKI